MKRLRLPPLSKKYQNLSKYPEALCTVFESFFPGELIIRWKSVPPDGYIKIEGFIPKNDPTPVTSFECTLKRFRGDRGEALYMVQRTKRTAVNQINHVLTHVQIENASAARTRNSAS
jgi:hypothetical protein